MPTQDEPAGRRPDGRTAPLPSDARKCRCCHGDGAPRYAATEAGPATTPGLVVTEDRLADGRAITYFGTAR